MIKRVVFLLGTKFNQRYYHRFGFDIIQKRGYKVEAWDFTPWWKSHYAKNYDVPDPIDFTDHKVFNNYNATKSAIIAISRYMAKYLSGNNIRVNCISPGGILNNQPISFLERYKSSCTSKGMLDAQDLVGTLLFLLSDQSKYINGQNIIVDVSWSL